MCNGPGSLNRVYRLVWSEATQAWVAVAELTRSRGKRSNAAASALAASLLVSASMAYAADPPALGALPTGGTVAAGTARIGQAGNAMNIVQGSDRAIINWQTFNIGANASVRFQQPSTSSMMLNRVMSTDPSAIFGSMTANGQVLLVNPNGIVFGPGSRVDVGGLVASSLSISNADFMAGRLNFSRSGSLGNISNKGTLNAAAQGYVAMLAPEVINEGVISARMGTVALAAGDAVTLDMSGTGLVGVRVDPGAINTLIENRHLVQADGGQIIVSVGAANRLLQQAVAGHSGATHLTETNGTLRLVSAGGQINAPGGQVHIEGSTVSAHGSIDVSGEQAGQIRITGDFVMQSGSARADSTANAGGRVDISGGSVIQTASTLVSADGAAGGGQINLKGGHTEGNGTVYSSATIQARGASGQAAGGLIDITAGSVQLRAATVDASGLGDGGRIRLGGGFRGQDTDILNARTVGVNGSTELVANAGTRGNGGQISVWSDGTTLFGGGVTARGGSESGNGGRAEVSGKHNLGFQGRVDLSAVKGRAGQFELDPHDIIIDDAAASIATLSLDDPNATATLDNHYGSTVTTLSNGNVIITAPNTTVNAKASAGATYLFNSRNGSLLDQIYGGNAHDHVGSGGVQVLSNGNYLVLSPDWNRTTTSGTFLNYNEYSASEFWTSSVATAGAITWRNGAPAGSTGASGSGGATSAGSVLAGNIVSSSNSLVGNTATFDRVGGLNGVQVAATSTTSSSTTAYRNGTSNIVTLTDGNLAIVHTEWNGGRGAVTWMNASNGQLGDGSSGGQISSANSLVGSTGYRLPGLKISAGGNNYYVTSHRDAKPAIVQNNPLLTGSSDPVDPGLGDGIGRSITLLPGGNMVIASPDFTNGSFTYAGAVTWFGSGNRTGVVSASNSLVGAASFDAIGSGGVRTFGVATSATSPKPNYAVLSPNWGGSNGFFSTDFKGAVTIVDGANGNISGVGARGTTVGSTNSLTGDAGAAVGTAQASLGVYFYHTINSTGQPIRGSAGLRLWTYEVDPLVDTQSQGVMLRSPLWGGTKGAVTVIRADGKLGDGSAAVGAISSSNSLVGAAASYSVGGESSPLFLQGDRVALRSDVSSKGAVTIVNTLNGEIAGSASIGATVGPSNSLVGASTADAVGNGGLMGVGTPDSDGRYPNFIVLSPNWGRTSNTSFNDKGAVTWVSGSAGLTGAVSDANSLVGNAGDFVGSVLLGRNRYAVPQQPNAGGIYNTGRVTYSGAATPNRNSTVSVMPSTGAYIVSSPTWGSSRGAVTWGDGMSGVSGVVSSSNSIVGTTARNVTTSTATQTHADGLSYTDTTYTEVAVGDFVGLSGRSLSNGAYIVSSPFWNGGRGAVTYISPTGKFSGGTVAATGAVGTSNSLTGSTPTDYTTTRLAGTAGGDASLSGEADLLTYYGLNLGDAVGAQMNLTRHFKVVESVLATDANQGVTTYIPTVPFVLASPYTRTTSTVAPATLPNQKITGYDYSSSLSSLTARILDVTGTSSFLVGSPAFNSGGSTSVGALTLGSQANGLPVGPLTSTNSLVGSQSFDRLGQNLSLTNFVGNTTTGVAVVGSGNLIVSLPSWNNSSASVSDAFNAATGKGAVTWVNPSVGMSGVISASTSLVGSTYGDRVGAGSLTMLSDGNAVMVSSNWSNNGAANAGAVTFLPGGSAVVGAVGPSNSLVGSKASDSVGSGGITVRASNAYFVLSPNWDNGVVTNAGAVSYGAAGTGVSGLVSSSNSLVGTASNSLLGNGGVTLLSSDAYVIRSSNWGDGTITNAGAVTYVPAGSTVTGTVSALNSLVGSTTSDQVGSNGITVLPSGAYFVASGNWANGTASAAGAVTYGPAGQGVVGAVSSSNSLVGRSTNDRVGGFTISVLSDQAATYTNVLVRSPYWNDHVAGKSSVGAITWLDGATGYVDGQSTGNRGATVSPLNSLVGVSANDMVGASVQTGLVSLSGVSTLTGDAYASGTSRIGDRAGRLTPLPGRSAVKGYLSDRNSLLGFNDPGADGTGSVLVSYLPYASTASEKLNYRMLVSTSAFSWDLGSYAGFFADNPRGVMAVSLVNESSSYASNGPLGRETNSVTAGDGTDWGIKTNLISSQAALNSYGLSSGVLPFTAGGNASNAIISPSVITSILNAGTDLTLQANNNITVYKPIAVANPAGNGGHLTLQAGRSVTLLAPITTDNGNLTIRANESNANGVVIADSGSSLGSLAQVLMHEGANIDAGTGNVSIVLANSSDKNKTLQTATRSSTANRYTFAFAPLSTDANSSGNIVLPSITAGQMTVVNEGGTGSVANFGNIRTNGDEVIEFQKTVSAPRNLSFSAFRNILLGGRTTSQTVSIGNAPSVTDKFGVVLNAANTGASGGVLLNNVSISSSNGDISIGGGALDSNGKPSGSAVANTVTLSDLGAVNVNGVGVSGVSSINAGTGALSMSGRSPVAGLDGVLIQGASTASPIVVNGSQITISGAYSSTGTHSGIDLSNVSIGSASTQQLNLLADGFSGSTEGSIDINGGLTLAGATGASMTVASSNPAGLASFGSSTAPTGGLWVRGNQLGALLQAANGFSDLTLGSTQQTGASALNGLDLATLFSSTPAPFNLTVAGGQGGMSVNQDITRGLASNKILKLQVAGGGTLNLASASIDAHQIQLAAAGTGAQISQSSGGSLTTPSLRLDAANAQVNLDQINQVTTVAGSIGGGTLVTGQTLSVGTAQGASGLSSSGSVTVRAAGATSDLQLDQALTSLAGNVTAVAGRHFINTVAGSQGLQTPAGRYLVYSAEPTSLPSSTVSARGMASGFDKRYAQSFTGSTPVYAGTGNWFFYANTPTLTVAPAGGTAVYGSTGSIGGTIVTGLIDGDTDATALTGTPVSVGGAFTPTGAGHRPVGSYPLSLTGMGTLSSPLGYSINLSTATDSIVITPRPVGVAADNKTKVYGESDPGLTYVSEAPAGNRGLLAGDGLSGTLARSAGEGVAATPYAITQGTLANSNYAISFTNGALTVTRRPVNVVATPKTKIYGEVDPALTYTAEVQSAGRGVKTGDTFAGGLTRATGENVSSTGYAVSQGTLSNANYDINFTGSFLQVSPRPVNVSADNKTKIYGEVDPALTMTIEGQTSGRGLLSSDTLSGALSRTSGETVPGGPYTIGQGNVANSNYAISFTNGALTVTRRPLTVTADNKDRLFGDKDPIFTFTANPTQLAFNDTGAVVRDVEYEVRRGITVSPGEYPIKISAGSADNYALSFVDGVLTVKPVALVRSENLIVQQAPQAQVSAAAGVSVPAPQPVSATPVAFSFQPGILTVRDGGMLGVSPPALAAQTPSITSAISGSAPVPGSGVSPISPPPSPLPTSTSPAPDSFPVTVISRPAGSGDSLLVNRPVPQLSVRAGSSFNLNIPQDAFATTRSDTKVSLTATLANGAPLPPWMKFDAQSGNVTGNPPPGFTGSLAVRILARDERGNQATQTVTISVGR